MRAGDFSELVEFSAPVVTNTLGQVTSTWSSQGQVWAKVISQHGKEAFEASRTNARLTIRVCIRNSLAVLSTWRMVWDSQTFYVKSVDTSQSKTDGVIWLTCEVVGAKW